MLKRIVILVIAIVGFSSCTSREYLNACGIEISTINMQIANEYSQLAVSYQVAIENSCFTIYNREKQGHLDKIERLEDKRTHYEMELKKHRIDYMRVIPIADSYRDVEKAIQTYYNR